MFAIDIGQNKGEIGAQAGRKSSAQTVMPRNSCCSGLLCGQVYQGTTCLLFGSLKHGLLQEHR